MESGKNKCKTTEPMKYVQSMSEVNVGMPKSKQCVSIKQSMDIVCDTCEINFPSFTNLGEHITKNHKRNRDFCCSACDSKFFTKMDLDNHYTDVHTSHKLDKVKNGKKGNKRSEYLKMLFHAVLLFVL